MSISWKPWASLGAPSPADDHDARACGAHPRSRAEAASSNLLALHCAVQKPAPTPHGTRARFAAIHRLISSFRVRAATPHHEHQRDPRDATEEGRRRWRASLKGFAKLPRPQKGPAALPDLTGQARWDNVGPSGAE